jgi:hypothetical protein
MKGVSVKFKKYFSMTVLLVVLQLPAGSGCSKSVKGPEYELRGQLRLYHLRDSVHGFHKKVQKEIARRLPDDSPRDYIRLVAGDENPNDFNVGSFITKRQIVAFNNLREGTDDVFDIHIPMIKHKQLDLLSAMAITDELESVLGRERLPDAATIFLDWSPSRDELIDLLVAAEVLGFNIGCEAIAKKILDSFGAELFQVFFEHPECFQPGAYESDENNVAARVWQRLVSSGVDRHVGREAFERLVHKYGCQDGMILSSGAVGDTISDFYEIRRFLTLEQALFAAFVMNPASVEFRDIRENAERDRLAAELFEPGNFVRRNSERKKHFRRIFNSLKNEHTEFAEIVRSYLTM